MILDRYDPIGARMYDGISKARPDWYQNFEAAQQSFMRVDSTMSRRFGLEGVWSDITSRLNEDLGDRYMRLGSDVGGQFPDPTKYFGTSDSLGNGDDRYTYEATRIIDQVLQLELDNPGTVPEDIISLMNMQAIEDRMREEAMASREDLMQITEQSRGTGGFARFMGSLSGGMYEFSQDPLQTVTMFYGNSRQLWRFAAQQAALNASIEVMRQPQVAQWYGELGLEYTAEQFYRNVSIAGVAGAGFAVGFRGAVAGAGVAGRELGPAVDRLRVGRDVATFTRALDEAQPNMLEALSIQQLRSGIEAMEAAGVRIGSEARAAIELASAIDENASLNPGLPAAQHAELLDIAILDVANGRIPEDLIYRAPEALPAEVLARGQPEMENLGGVIYRFDPRNIQVDARTFQFKGGGDEFGVTDRLQNITEWDPNLAGTVTVYQYADGSMYIADGHQRVALAKRLMAQNPNLKIDLYGYLVREVDGISPQEAMVQAAITNISQAPPGAATSQMVIDAAKIARMNSQRFQNLIGRTLSPTSQVVRQARDMMDLTEDAFGAVINEVIPSNYGAVVGRILKDRPELQQAAIGILAKAEPANVFQAEAIVRQVREADFDVATQQSLFGEEMVVESLYTERARVLDRAVKTLSQDRAAFANLVRNAESIESAGNVLDRSVNQRRADLDGQAIALIQTLANRKGVLSDALSDAARLARDTGSYGASTRQFVESIRRAIADGDFERLTSGEIGRIVNDTPPSSRSEVGKEPSLTGFDEPTGHGPAFEQQADDLTREMFPEPEPAPPAARAQEPAEELDARSPIEEDRVPLEEIRMPVDDTLPLDQIRAQVRALTQENIPIVRDLMQRIDERFGTRSGDSVKDLSKVTQKANRPSIIAKKPWHSVSHIRDSYRFKTVIDDIRDVPAIFDELLASGIQLVKVDTGKLFSPKEWGWRIIAFDLRMPNGQLVEWYLPIRELEAQKKAEGHLLFEEWRNKSAEDINVEMDAYMATIQRSFEGYDRAFQASLDRMGISREEASASWASAESSMLEAARKSPSSSGMITSSGERVLDIQDPSRVRMAQEPDGKNIITREVPSSIRAEEGVSTGAAPMFEMTGAGEQTLIPGVDPISDIGLAQAQMQRPLRGGQAALPEGGLFDETARAQQDLFADVNLDEEIPVSAIVDPQTGEIVPQTMTMRDLKQMLDEEDSFMDRLGYCTQ
jgi:hypothetical protein